MLFADVVGYSNLTEEQIPRFAERFMGAAADLVAKTDYPPVIGNTWGDAIYLVFKSVEDAGKFALDLRFLVCLKNWEDVELPKELSIRIALHAGPAYSWEDPITKQQNYIGSHVNRAARIEPVTPPGEVYASQAFAALAAARGAGELAFDYVGQMALAKGFGTYPTYHVRPGSASCGA